MKNKDKFSVILAHYKQIEFVFGAIDSVLKQNFPSIQLIIADDCSLTEEEIKRVNDYIKDNKKKNIVDYEVIHNETNVGTVKNINSALAKATGDYILFFAADDALYDENVLDNFYKSFEENKDINVITAQCYMFDKTMTTDSGPYVDKYIGEKLNKLSAIDQFKEMAFSCIYGSGGTAYRKSVFKRCGKFNEEFKLVEDWAYWLHITSHEEKIVFINFPALKHRDGGVSHNTYKGKNVPDHVKQYYKDIIRIYEEEILTNLSLFDNSRKNALLKKYGSTLDYYSKSIPEFVKGRKKNIKDAYLKDNDLLKYKFIKLFNVYLKKTLKYILKYILLFIILYCSLVLTKITTFKDMNIYLILIFCIDLNIILNNRILHKNSGR